MAVNEPTGMAIPEAPANVVEMQKHIGISYDGKPVEHDQWRVFLDGLHVAYLSYAPGTRLMPLLSIHPHDTRWEHIRAECERLRDPPGEVLSAEPIFVPPPEFLKQHAAANIESDEDDQEEEDDE